MKNAKSHVKDTTVMKTSKAKEPDIEKHLSDSIKTTYDVECYYCDFYSTSDEGWISGIQYKQWAHNSCAGVDSDDDEVIFMCELCK